MEQNYYRKTENEKEYILCAAIHVDNDIIYEHQPKNIEKGIVVCGRRHHNCFLTLSKTNIKYKRSTKQGFITNKDRFVDRKEAGEIAFACGQTEKLEKTLFSEDLY